MVAISLRLTISSVNRDFFSAMGAHRVFWLFRVTYLLYMVLLRMWLIALPLNTNLGIVGKQGDRRQERLCLWNKKNLQVTQGHLRSFKITLMSGTCARCY